MALGLLGGGQGSRGRSAGAAGRPPDRASNETLGPAEATGALDLGPTKEPGSLAGPPTDPGPFVG